jgi:hypothetical protein
MWARPRRTIWSLRSPTIDWPSNATLPSATGTMPEMARRVVVLPAPFEPISATISPG